MPIPTGNQWKMIGVRSKMMWNLPNCSGALDEEHIQIKKFSNIAY